MRFLLFMLASAGLLLAAPIAKTWENLGQLTPGAPIEVVTNNLREKGEFVSVSTESLTIRTRSGEQKVPRPEVVLVIRCTNPRRMRSFLIGVGVGAAISLVTDSTLGRYLRNEGHNARAVIWGVPIAVCGGVGAAIPSYPVIYRK